MQLSGNIAKDTETRGIIDLPGGFAKDLGLGLIITRELVGVYGFVTAPFPLPAGFKPVIHPKYPWSYCK